MKIFELSVYFFSTEKLQYPLSIENKKSFTMYSSIELAKQALDEYLKAPSDSALFGLYDEDQVLYFKIQEKPVDNYSAYVNQDLWFNSNGDLIYHDIDQAFSGRDNPKYKIGDLVQFFEYNQLKLGVIYALPLSTEFVNNRPNAKFDQTDDVYLIDELDGEHSHIQEAFIQYPMFPISFKEKNAYDELKRDVLDRILNNSRNPPKKIKIEE